MYWHHRRDHEGRAKSPAFLFYEAHNGQRRPMIDNPGKRIAAGFLKLFAGVAIALLLLTQMIDNASEPDSTGSNIEANQQQE